MPTVTCPYCKQESASKFIHKQHIRNAHTDLFNNNIKTCLTGAKCELDAIDMGKRFNGSYLASIVVDCATNKVVLRMRTREGEFEFQIDDGLVVDLSTNSIQFPNTPFVVHNLPVVQQQAVPNTDAPTTTSSTTSSTECLPPTPEVVDLVNEMVDIVDKTVPNTLMDLFG